MTSYKKIIMKLSYALVKITTFLPTVFVNGKFYKDPMLAIADDFFLLGPDIPKSTLNPVGFVGGDHNLTPYNYSKNRPMWHNVE